MRRRHGMWLNGTVLVTVATVMVSALRQVPPID